MKYFYLSGILFVIAWYVYTGCSPSEAQTSKPPNVVLIFTDDQGYGDIGCYGATGFQTPNIDRLASQGVRFTNHYSAQPVCTASRAGLLTGCYPNRIGMYGALFPHDSVGINPDELTLAEMLKQEGYATACFGKWHLGHHEKFLPLQHGFDEYTGVPYSNDMWPINLDNSHAEPDSYKGRFPELPLVEGNEVSKFLTTMQDQDALTKLFTEKAVDFIQRNASNPFFLYVPHSMPHVPLGVSDAFRGKSEQGLYGDVMMEIDWSVGQIMQTLVDLDLAENTIFIFTTDNGPWINYGNHAGSTGGLREGKTTSWEGGQRVPFIVRWPGQTPAGTISNKLSCNIDIMPSIASIIGAALPDHPIDGLDVSSLWKGDHTTNPRRTIYYYHNRNHLIAVRHDNWKLVLPHTFRSYATAPGNDGIGGPRIATDVETPELYDMIRDPGEDYNVIDLYPEKAEEIMKIVADARNDLGDLLVDKPTGLGSRPIGHL